MVEEDSRSWDGRKAREVIRAGKYDGPTSGIAASFVQANLLIVFGRQNAKDFQDFAFFNEAPCPVLEHVPAGTRTTLLLAKDGDVYTDVPRYELLTAEAKKNGESKFAIKREEHTDVSVLYDDTCEAFLLGCSFSFEEALRDAGVWNGEAGINVPMFRTSRATTPVGPFEGPLVVSMRYIDKAKLRECYTITDRYRKTHGRPVYHGENYTRDLGIKDLNCPDYGEASQPTGPDQVPVFWACGVTSQVAVYNALQTGKIDRVIVHKPGHMFISDVPSKAVEGLAPNDVLSLDTVATA